MKKIALITIDYPPQQGGVARYLWNLAKALGSSTVTVFVDRTHPDSIDAPAEKIRLFAPGPFGWWISIFQMWAMRGRGYDGIMVSHVLPLGTAAMIARYFGGVPYIVLLHGLDIRLAKKSRIKQWLFRKIIKKAKLVLVNSQRAGEELHSIIKGQSFRVLLPAVEQDQKLPDKASSRAKFGIGAGDTLVLSVARLVPRKGIDRLIESMSFVDASVKLVVLGDGSDRERLDRHAQHFGERVQFVSNVSDQTKQEWYAAADLFALPVREEEDDIEGFGIVFLEAALFGLVAIAGNSGGVPEAVLDGVTGLLVDPHHPRRIADAIEALRKDSQLKKRLGEAARNRAIKDFRWEDRARVLRTWMSQL
ncbi:MAG: glycosyltransferase family 4 protein [Candidatus Magasanikbacteria bacterium]|nr:glycosyltransferase family 4 protein [Candidatus Magasanikbacteria bacterium]MCA9391453.1 glycosyltransferase family 4 protein [Candidatus Magasanikbacteria bacterium]